MTVINKSAAASEVAASFPDNTVGTITPTGARNLLNDLIDSTLFILDPAASTGGMLYYPAASTAPSILNLSAPGSIMVAGASAPSWVTVASAAGAIPYYGTGSTLTGLPLSAVGSILQAGASAPSWLAPGGSGTVLSGIAGSTPAYTAGPILGVPGTTAGSLSIAGSSTGSRVTLTANPSGATFTLQLPSSTGGSGFLLATTGGVTNWVNGRQIPGDTTGVAASSGFVGEYISSAITAAGAIALTTGNASNITSISLTAGDWDAAGAVVISASSTQLTGWIGTVSATPPTPPGSGAYSQLIGTFSNTSQFPVGQARIILSTTTTVFLSALSVFAGTSSAYGFIGARRRT